MLLFQCNNSIFSFTSFVLSDFNNTISDLTLAFLLFSKSLFPTSILSLCVCVCVEKVILLCVCDFTEYH